MPQGPLRQILMPPPVQSGPPVQLDQTPLAQTNPGLARLVDFFGGLMGVKDALDPQSSNATMAGAGLGAAIPLMGTLGSLKRVTQPIKAYHGSPHDFDKFSLSKIGTGEGAQAYGHGLYFAENPGVAADYQKTLANKFTNINRTELTKRAAEDLGESSKYLPWAVLQQLEAGTPIDDIAFALSKDPLTRGRLPEEIQRATEYVKRNFPGHAAVKGKMYEVGLHASPDEFLDWDKPLSQQSEKVRQALTAAMRKDKYPEAAITELMADAGPAAKIYTELAGGRNSEAAAKASESLKAAGIKGIRYLDQGSRGMSSGGVNKLGDNWFIKGSSTPYKTQQAAEDAAVAAGQRTSNFVVFDDDIIEIKKKLALLLAAGAGTAAATQKDRK